MAIVIIVGGSANINGPVGARLRVKTLAINGPCLPSTRRQNSEYARHIFVYFTSNKISQVYDILERSEKQSKAQAVVLPPSLRPPPPQISINMRQFYADYIACIINGRMVQELHQFSNHQGSCGMAFT